MLKRIIILSFAMLIFPSLVFAQEVTVSTRTPTLKQKINVLKNDRAGKIEEFKARLAQIKDERKKELAQRIANKIENSNKRLTDKMTRALERLSTILNKIGDKEAALKAKGEDTTNLKNAIVNAKTAIDEAKQAVSEQAAREYSAELADDSLLKAAIGRMVSSFRLDIVSAHKTVIAAKQAVSKAISELAKLGGVRKNATESGSFE